MAKRIEELPIFSKAMAFWSGVTALLERPLLRRDRHLWTQVSAANDSIPANMREGFEQSSDDGFARYLVTSKASLAEVLVRLHESRLKRYITDEELAACQAAGEELAKMLGGFIKYLKRSAFKDRGTYRITHS